jgi:hypothetical protein
MMKTLNFFLAICLSVLTFTATAQVTGNPEIQQRLDRFIELTNQKNWNEAFDILYPKMFTSISKQELVDIMNSEETNGITLQLANRRITAFSSPFEDGGETFVRVSFTADQTVAIKSGGMYDYPKSITGMEQQFKQTYGDNNVKWNEEQKTFTILAHKSMIAVRQEGKDWYLVEINPEQPELMESLFSEAVLNALVRVE